MDGMCVNDWTGFEAVHIFPLSGEDYWLQNGFSRWITNRMGGNGLLMQSNIHRKFDGRDGTILGPICRDPHNEDIARDELLRWHFRQATLANMWGGEHRSLDPNGPEAGRSMEAELFSRLNGLPFA
ncbi:hypothetical protein V1508DRAFT_405498 [Lipomyces doorenjongii]|uniref:uncharacterized protein n=1 Tax=Lipomyces doorenjongii TaxID=383834 RepID=UPI0034CFA8DB